MFDRFTDESKRAMNSARLESMRLRHAYLGPEHMFLAMLAATDGLALRILRELACDPRLLRDEVERVLIPGTTPLAAITQVPFTASAKKVLELAMGDASAFAHPVIGTGHLLTGLLGVVDSVPARVLAARSVTLDIVRAKVIAHGGWDTPPEVVVEDTGRRMHVLRQAIAVLRAVGEMDTAVQVQRALDRLA